MSLFISLILVYLELFKGACELLRIIVYFYWQECWALIFIFVFFTVVYLEVKRFVKFFFESNIKFKNSCIQILHKSSSGMLTTSLFIPPSASMIHNSPLLLNCRWNIYQECTCVDYINCSLLPSHCRIESYAVCLRNPPSINQSMKLFSSHHTCHPGVLRQGVPQRAAGSFLRRSDYHSNGVLLQWVKAKDDAKPPRIHKTAPSKN